MDEAGIDKTVILGLDYEYLFKGKISYKEYNDYVANILKEYPDRFIGFAGIDPRRGKEAIQELERCIGELEFKWRGRFLLIAFLSFFFGTIFDAILELNILTIIIVRVILVTSSIEYYFGFFLPDKIKNVLIKKE